MLMSWGYGAGLGEASIASNTAESGGILSALSDRVMSLVQSAGIVGAESNIVEILLIALAAVFIAGLVVNIGLRTTKAFKRKSPEKLAGEMIDNHVAFVQKFVDEMQLALSAGPADPSTADGPMKVLMDRSEAAWEQVAKLGEENPAIERAFYSYLNSLKRLSVMEKAVLARSEIAELDTSDFEFQHPIAEAAAGLRVLSRALGRSGASKKDRLARYELTALSEDAEVIWDELKARADAANFSPNVILRAQTDFDAREQIQELDDRPVPHLYDSHEQKAARDEDRATQSQSGETSEIDEQSGAKERPVKSDTFSTGARSGNEIADQAQARARRRRRRR